MELELKPGTQVWYYKRVATIVEYNAVGARLAVEHTDEGGITRRYALMGSTLISALPGSDLTILDVLAETTRPELTVTEQLERIAERWLADPQPGDVYRRDGVMTLMLLELRTDGSIVGHVTRPDPNVDGTAGETVIFQSDEALRRCYRYKTKPGYWALPVSSLRPDYEDHPLVGRTPSSPLFDEGRDVQSKDS